jgi:hypothetical protein
VYPVLGGKQRGEENPVKIGENSQKKAVNANCFEAHFHPENSPDFTPNFAPIFGEKSLLVEADHYM